MRTIIAANWKMNKTRTEAKATAHELASILGGAPDDRDVVVFAPFTALEATREGLDGAPGIFVGAQNMYPAESGAFTGEISPAMLREAGCTWVLTGHSERRHVLGESPDFVGKKTAFALEQGFSVILCIGETLAERKAGKLNSILWLQLERGLAGLGPNADYSRLAVAYEPVWAIGTGQTASDEDIRMVHTLVRELLSSLLGSNGIGIQILYDMFNRREDTWCERVYSPWPDLHKVMKEQHIPLFALESQDPLKEFDFLGITLQYEMCYTNILQVLDLAEIPIWSKDREKGDPIVIGGGPCSYNPEPIADFFDIFYIGEGETVYGDLIELYKIYKHSDMTREEFLIKVSQIPGLYVPALYDVTYHEDGTIASFGPKYEGVPKTILKQVVTDMSSAVYPEKPVVSYMKVTQDRVVLEIMRGCIRGCRFCQAGMIYRPTRPKDVNVLKHYAEAMLDNTGQEEITFSSLSSSDYQSLPELTDCLIEKMDNNHVNISLPSLRIDAFSLDVMQKIQDIKKNSLTFAPEAGTQRLRNVINKGLTKENILNGSLQAFLGGWNKVKLYFMMGLPTETYDDITGIADLSEEISELYFANIPKEKRDGRVMVSASASYFVPKPFTPFQWAPMITPEEFQKRAYFVKDKFREAKNHKSLKFAYHEADITILEGLLARGDRKLCQVIYDVYQSGQIFDAWTEYFDKSNWDNALEKNHIDIGFYTYRDRCVDEILPWDFIDIGVTRKFMEKEWERAQAEVVTPNCRMKCSGCGAAKFGGGVCFENKN